jgi:hypothetical protein
MVYISVKNGMRTVGSSGSKIFYDALLVFDIPCSVSDTLNGVLYAMHPVVVDLYFYAFVGRRTYHGRRVDVICCLTGRVLGI